MGDKYDDNFDKKVPDTYRTDESITIHYAQETRPNTYGEQENSFATFGSGSYTTEEAKDIPAPAKNTSFFDTSNLSETDINTFRQMSEAYEAGNKGMAIYLFQTSSPELREFLMGRVKENFIKTINNSLKDIPAKQLEKSSETINQEGKWESFDTAGNTESEQPEPTTLACSSTRDGDYELIISYRSDHSTDFTLTINNALDFQNKAAAELFEKAGTRNTFQASGENNPLFYHQTYYQCHPVDAVITLLERGLIPETMVENLREVLDIEAVPTPERQAEQTNEDLALFKNGPTVLF